MKRFFLILVLFLVVLGFRFFLFFSYIPTYSNGAEITREMRIFTTPHVKNNTQRFTILENGTRIHVVAAQFPRYEYGQKLKVYGKLKVLDMQGKEVLFLYFPRIEVLSGSDNLAIAMLSWFRGEVVSLFQASLPSNSASLMLGIVFGIKEGFSSTFLDNLSKTGVLHVVAASGMNVSIIAGFLFTAFAHFLKRQYAVIVASMGILFYAALSGFEPSIVRASIMGILVFSAQLLGRQTLSSYILLLTGFVMLFVNPSLIEDIGFQLSFLATSGILYIKPLLNPLVSKLKLFVISADLETTLASQIATLPILVLNFQTFSLVSVLVNILVLWTVPLLMIIGGVASIVGFISEFLGQLILYLSLPLLWYFEAVTTFFGTHSFSIQIEISSESSLYFGLGYYLILIGFVLLLRRKPQT